LCCLLSIAALSLGAFDAAAQGTRGRRARLSDDLAQKLRAGDARPSTVIFTGSQARVDQVAARHGLRIRKRLKSGALLEVPGHQLQAVAEDPEVDNLSGNHRVTAQMTTGVQSTGADLVQGGLTQLGAAGLTGAGVGIAVIDSGVAFVPELRGRIVASKDFTDDRGFGVDEHGHGTHVAGIAAAAGRHANDDTRGMAPGAHLVSLRVLDAKGRGYAADVTEAIDWAIDNKRRYKIGVINLSLGGPVLQSWRDDPVAQAVERAYRAGIVVVAAAGNFGKDAQGRSVYGGITSPGNSPFAITVGAINTMGTPWRSDDELASYSSKGPTLYDRLIKPDMVAPGNRIRGLLAPGSTLAATHPELITGTGRDARVELSGTSMAAPFVSGAVASLLEGNGRLSPGAVRILLQYSAEPLFKEGLLGGGAGSLNLAAARELQVRGAVNATVVAGNTVAAGQVVFASKDLWTAENILWGSDENILWESDENILWGSDEKILWGSNENILWGSDENILWGSDENILWGSDENILWGSDENILWGSDENILWGSDENILWGSDENILWGSDENILWGSDENILWGSDENILWGSDENILWGSVYAD
jgi:serine protease AprX